MDRANGIPISEATMFTLGASPKRRSVNLGVTLFALVTTLLISGLAGFVPGAALAAPFAKAANPIEPAQRNDAVDVPGTAIDLRAFPVAPSEPVTIGQSFSKTPNSINAIGCATAVLPNDGGSSGNARAPQIRSRYERSVYLIKASERPCR